jgi:hypothetical protein
VSNNLSITNADGVEVATAWLGLACANYFDHLARKYNPNFIMFGDLATIDQRLEPIYRQAEQAAPHDYAVMLLFVNKKTTFKDEDVPAFERALSEYPPTFHEGPRRVISKFLTMLRQHHQLTVEYVNTTGPLIVTKAPINDF